MDKSEKKEKKDVKLNFEAAFQSYSLNGFEIILLEWGMEQTK